MKNGDFVNWSTLLEKLTDINIATVNNLFVIFATCSAASNIQYIWPREKPFPYYTAIAPEKPEFPVFLELKYSLFYMGLIIDENMEVAFREVIKDEGYSKIIPYTCEFYLYCGYFKALDNLKSDKDAIDRFVEILSREEISSKFNNDQLREIITKTISNPNIGSETLQNNKNKYLMANYPQNSDRFGFTAKELFDSFKYYQGILLTGSS